MADKILKFSAGFCQPCKMLAATLEGEDLGIPVESIDIEENPELAQEYGVRGVPTMILIRNDEHVATLMGYNNLSKIKNWVDSN